MLKGVFRSGFSSAIGEWRSTNSDSKCLCSDTTTPDLLGDPWVVQMPRGIFPYAVNIKKMAEEAIKEYQHGNRNINEGLQDGNKKEQNEEQNEVIKEYQRDDRNFNEGLQDENKKQNEAIKEYQRDDRNTNDSLQDENKKQDEEQNKVAGEQSDDGSNQCLKEDGDAVKNYEKEIDQLKRKLRKKTVSEIKLEKSLEEKTKIINELQSKCDDLTKEVDMLRSSQQGPSSQQADVEESINEQLDNEEVQQKEVIPGTVRIELMKGTDLLACNVDDTSDPYCYVGVINLKEQKEITSAFWSIEKLCQYNMVEAVYKTSSTISCTVDPVWEEYFELPVKDITTSALMIEVWDDDKQGNKLRNRKILEQSGSEDGDGFIGRGFLPISMIRSDNMEWALPIYGKTKKKIINGEIWVLVSMLNGEEDADTDQSGN